MKRFKKSYAGAYSGYFKFSTDDVDGKHVIFEVLNTMDQATMFPPLRIRQIAMALLEAADVAEQNRRDWR